MTIVGKTGRVSGTIPAGGEQQGEVMIDGQAYFATCEDTSNPVPRGTRVLVIEHYPPRTIVITPI